MLSGGGDLELVKIIWANWGPRKDGCENEMGKIYCTYIYIVGLKGEVYFKLPCMVLKEAELDD